MNHTSPIQRELSGRYAEIRNRLYAPPEKPAFERFAGPPESVEEAVDHARRDILVVASDPPPALKWKHILAEVSRQHGVSIIEICGIDRHRKFMLARHEAFYRLRTETGMSLPQIGKRMGGFDHTTVLNGIRKHKQRMGIE